MDKSTNTGASGCCAMEKKRLMEELRKCDFCSESISTRHQCYRSAAKDSGRKARQCMMD